MSNGATDHSPEANMMEDGKWQNNIGNCSAPARPKRAPSSTDGYLGRRGGYKQRKNEEGHEETETQTA